MKEEYGNQNGEFGKAVEENFKQPPEVVEYPEVKTYKEQADTPEEIKSYSEEAKTVQNPKAKAKKKQSKLSSILKSTSFLVAAVAAVTIISPNILSGDATSVTFQEMVIKDTSVGYFIVFDNWSGKDYDVVLYNDFTKRTVTVNKETFTQYSADGTESEIVTQFYNEEKDLKSGMTYTLAVKSGYKTIAETSFRTLRADEMPVTKLNGVTAKCACEMDGTFHFTMDFEDGNDWWHDFVATLTDAEGNVSTCTFDYSDLTGLQTIPVTDVLVGTSATLKISCTSYEDVEDGGETKDVVLYEEEVDI